MKNRITSARTAAQKSTKVETQNPSSHSNGNTFVGCRRFCSNFLNFIFICICDYWYPLFGLLVMVLFWFGMIKILKNLFVSHLGYMLVSL